MIDKILGEYYFEGLQETLKSLSPEYLHKTNTSPLTNDPQFASHIANEIVHQFISRSQPVLEKKATSSWGSIVTNGFKRIETVPANFPVTNNEEIYNFCVQNVELLREHYQKYVEDFLSPDHSVYWRYKSKEIEDEARMALMSLDVSVLHRFALKTTNMMRDEFKDRENKEKSNTQLIWPELNNHLDKLENICPDFKLLVTRDPTSAILEILMVMETGSKTLRQLDELMRVRPRTKKQFERRLKSYVKVRNILMFYILNDMTALRPDKFTNAERDQAYAFWSVTNIEEIFQFTCNMARRT